MTSEKHNQTRNVLTLGIVGVAVIVCAFGCLIFALLTNFLREVPVDELPALLWAEPRAFEIDSKQGWQESGIHVFQGEAVQISYQSGQWRVADWAEYVDADGYPRFEGYAPDIAHGALLAQIADGPIIPIYNEAWFIADSDGILSFRINDADEFLYDNIGAIEVVIELDR